MLRIAIKTARDFYENVEREKKKEEKMESVKEERKVLKSFKLQIFQRG